MAISITSQPAANSLNAAYRPIVLTISIVPAGPVMYCDIYFGGVYYKTESKTQGNAFDVQNAAKEYLKKWLPPLGGKDILMAGAGITSCFCKIRASHIDVNGFTVIDTPIPVQATGTTPAASGGGTQSNTFYIINAALQHEDNQNLPAHLNEYKEGTWASNAYPLTHRVNGYQANTQASDYFPIVANNAPSGLTLHYRLRSTGLWYSTSGGNTPPDPPTDPPPDPVCVPVTLPTISFPNAQVGVPYSYSFTVSGSPAFTIPGNSITKPTWMNIIINGQTGQVTVTGTPTVEGNSIQVTFTINNACTPGGAPVSYTIDTAPTAPPAGQTYNLTAPIAGDTVYVYCKQGGNAAPAPFDTLITLAYTLNDPNGPPVEGTATATLTAGQTQVFIFISNGMEITTAAITSAVPSTNGTDTYTF